MKSWRGFWREALCAGAALFSTAAPCQAPTFHEIIQPEVDRGRMAGAAGVMVTANEVLAFPLVGYANLESKKPSRRCWICS